MKRIACLLCGMALLLLLLPVGASAQYEEHTVVGSVPALTTSNTGNGSLTDQSDLGAAVADAAIYASGAQLAVMCGGDLAGNLAPGPCTYGDLLWVFHYDPQLATVQVTAEQLRQLLEFCLSHITVDLATKRIDRAVSAFYAFPQVGGFTLEYDASAPVGERVRRVELSSGQVLDWADANLYTLVCPVELLAGAYGETGISITYVPMDMTACQALAQLVASGQMGQYLDVQRVTVVGTTDNSLFEEFGLVPILLFGALVILTFGSLKKDNRAQRQGLYY